MAVDVSDAPYGLPGHQWFGTDNIAGARAYNYQSGANGLKPQICNSATVFSGITTPDGYCGIPACPGLVVQISTIVQTGQSITVDTLYNFETTNGRVDSNTAGGTAVKAREGHTNIGGSPEILLLHYEIWKPRG